MSKGLEALEKIDHTICLNNLAKNIVWNIDKEEKCDCESIEQFVECYDAIEKELTQAEEDRKILDIFKNAIKFERKDFVITSEHDDDKDTFSYFLKPLYKMVEKEINEEQQKALRKWVLKNICPKELKALDVIKKYFWLEDFQDFIAFNGMLPKVLKEEYDLLKEVLCH